MSDIPRLPANAPSPAPEGLGMSKKGLAKVDEALEALGDANRIVDKVKQNPIAAKDAEAVGDAVEDIAEVEEDLEKIKRDIDRDPTLTRAEKAQVKQIVEAVETVVKEKRTDLEIALDDLRQELRRYQRSSRQLHRLNTRVEWFEQRTQYIGNEAQELPDTFLQGLDAARDRGFKQRQAGRDERKEVDALATRANEEHRTSSDKA